jgi:hypothetical protein
MATWLGHLVRALSFVHQLDVSQIDEWGGAVATFLRRWAQQRSLLGRGDDLLAAIANQTEGRPVSSV